MKLLLTSLILFSATNALAKPTPSKFICSVKHSKYVVAVAEQHSTFDKNRHCTVSCMLSLRCNSNEVLLVGILKEFRDIFGPGNAEREDIIADKYGINLVRTKRAMTDQECLQQCDLKY